MKEKMLKILELAIDLKEVGIDVFVNYSPHIDTPIDIHYYINGYGENKKAIYLWQTNHFTLDGIIERLEGLK